MQTESRKNAEVDDKGGGTPVVHVVVAIPTPKSSPDEEKEAREESVCLLNERPHMRTIPAQLKKKWSQKQIRVREDANMTVKREKKKMYSAAKRKRKAASSVQHVKHGHGEEPEFLAATRKKGNPF
jgi:IS30 family transposase